MALPKEKSVPTHKSRYFIARIFEIEDKRVLRFDAAAQLGTWLTKHFKVGQKMHVFITDEQPKRTLRQNSFYWAYLRDIAQEVGETAERLHFFFKWEFLPHDPITVYGKRVPTDVSTTEMTINEFSEYIDRIAAYTGILPPTKESFGLREMPYRGKENS